MCPLTPRRQPAPPGDPDAPALQGECQPLRTVVATAAPVRVERRHTATTRCTGSARTWCQLRPESPGDKRTQVLASGLQTPDRRHWLPPTPARRHHEVRSGNRRSSRPLAMHPVPHAARPRWEAGRRQMVGTARLSRHDHRRCLEASHRPYALSHERLWRRNPIVLVRFAINKAERTEHHAPASSFDHDKAAHRVGWAACVWWPQTRGRPLVFLATST